MNRNISGNAYALTMLCPIKPGVEGNRIYADLIRDRLESWNLEDCEPIGKSAEYLFMPILRVG